MNESEIDSHEISSRSITELLEIVMSGGSVSLADIPQNERRVILDWYKNSSETDDDRVAYLEQFILYGLVDDADALQYARGFSKDEKGILGEFIGKVITPGLYVQTFYECWPEIDFVTQESLVAILQLSPEGSRMIAPFINLESIKGKGLIEVRGRMVSKSILEDQFHSAAHAKTLLESLIRYMEFHGDNKFIRVIVHHFLRYKPYVLFPFLVKLNDFGIITDGDASRMFEHDSYLRADVSEEEKRYRSELVKKIKGAQDDDSFFVSSDVSAPRKIAIQIENIDDELSIKDAETILSNFQEHRKKFSFDTTAFLENLIDNGVPVFYMVRQLGLSKDEVKVMLLKCSRDIGPISSLKSMDDIRVLLEWNREVEAGPDLEKTIVDLLLMDLDMIPNLAIYIKTISTWFQENSRKRLIEGISKRAPHLWLLNLDYMIEMKVMSLADIVAKVSRTDTEAFLSQYKTVLFHLAQRTSEDRDIPGDIRALRDSVRNIFYENPQLFFMKKFSHVVEDVFRGKERDVFIHNQLASMHVNKEFFISLLCSDELDGYVKECKRLLYADFTLFSEALGRPETINVLSITELTDLLILNIEIVNFQEIYLDNEDLMQILLESPRNLKRFIDSLMKSNNKIGLLAVVTSLQFEREVSQRRVQDFSDEVKNLKIRLENEKELKERKKIKDRLAELDDCEPLIDDLMKRIGHIETSINQLKEQILRIAQELKFFVFKGDVIEILGDEAHEIVRREIEEYSIQYPEILMRKHRLRHRHEHHQSVFVFEDILGEDEFTRLILLRKRAIAFEANKYGPAIPLDGLPGELTEEIHSLNPTVDVAIRKDPREDFYQAVVDKIKGYSFFPLYEDILKEIVHYQMSNYGPTLKPDNVIIDSRFSSIVKILSLLELSSIAQRNSEEIIRLAPDDRDEIISLLSFLSFYSVDENVSFDLKVDSVQKVKYDLVLQVLDLSKRLFGVVISEVPTWVLVDTDTINALSVFYKGSVDQDTQMTERFRKVITEILHGTYYDWRAWGDTGAPVDYADADAKLSEMKRAGLLPSNITLDQYLRWIQTEKIDFNEVLSYHLSDVQSGIRDIFSLAVVDGHIEDSVLNLDPLSFQHEYDSLLSPLKELSKKQMEFKRRIKKSKKFPDLRLSEEEFEEYEDVQREIIQFREDNASSILMLEAKRFIAKLKKISAEELQEKCLIIDKKHVPFSDVFDTIEMAFEDHPDFINDMRRIRGLLNESNIQLFNGNRVSRSQLYITDEVDLKTHIFIGEKPVPSCQHYNGNSELNKGLLAYISDPSVRICQIWDETGKIISRAIFRLMEDQNGNPHIFVERVYSLNAHPKLKEAIMKLIKHKADHMGMSVFTREIGFDEILGDSFKGEDHITLHNRGSRSPFVYTDAGGGTKPNGVFKIQLVA